LGFLDNTSYLCCMFVRVKTTKNSPKKYVQIVKCPQNMVRKVEHKFVKLWQDNFQTISS